MWAAQSASGRAAALLAAKIANDFFHDFPRCRFNACRQAPFSLWKQFLQKGAASLLIVRNSCQM